MSNLKRITDDQKGILMCRAKKSAFGLLFGTLLALSGAVFGQEDACPVIVQTALETVDSSCTRTGRNQACYGNLVVTVTVQEGVHDLVFDAPGDKGNVAVMKSLRLSPMDEATGEWGVSLMKLQTNLPDSLPGQNVTLLLFGDVQIRNLFGETPEPYAPMQAFYFQSGFGDARCKEVPDSGLLIQTPQGAGNVKFVVNGVEISLGSTAYLQAAPDDALYVNLLEGQATVTAFRKTQTVPAGTVVRVPLDANLDVSGPPSEPEPYSADRVESLAGVVAVLPEAITPSEPVTPKESCAVTAGDNVNLRSGPGTNYARAGGLAANESANPTGQAQGADGYTWWQLAGGNWVRVDVIEASGPCEDLPVVTDLPPTPTPLPVSGSTSTGRGTANIHLGSSAGGPCWGDTDIVAGQPVLLSRVYCKEEWQSFGDAQATFAGVTPTFSIDGLEQIVGKLDGFVCCNGDGYNCTRAVANWVATPGSHTMTSYLGPYVWSCTFSVGG